MWLPARPEGRPARARRPEKTSPCKGEDWPKTLQAIAFGLIPALLFVLFARTALAAPAGEERPFLIRNVTVLTMTEQGIIEDGAVLVRGSRIEAVGPAAKIAAPPGAPLLNGEGYFLIPGLIDAHVHLDHPSVLGTFLDHGVTTVLNMRGFPEVLRWRREIAEGRRTGPLIYTSGDIIESAPGSWEGFTLIDSGKAARAVVRLQTQAGYDFVKVYHGISADHLRDVVKAARKEGRAVIGHAPHDVPVKKAARLGLAAFAHGMELLRGYATPEEAAREARDIAREVRKRNVWATPNLVYLDTLARQQANPSLILTEPGYGRLHASLRQWFNPAQNPYAGQGAETGAWNRRRLEAVRTLTKELHRAGVPLLAGSDALAAGIFPDAALFEEFALLRSAGLTPLQALETATVRGGQFIRQHIDRQARLGVIAPGARADFVLIADDPRRHAPTADAIRGVIAAGRLHGAWGASAGRLYGASGDNAASGAVTRMAALGRAGKWDEARALYDAVRRARPREILFHRFAFLNLARPLLFDGNTPVRDRARLEMAVIAFTMYTDTYPGLHIGHIHLAQALSGLGRCSEARAALDRARSLSTGHPLIEKTAKLCGG